MTLKERAIAEVNTLSAYRKKYDKTIRDADERVLAYIDRVIENVDKHNAYELLAIVRFYHFLSKYDFRTSEVRKFIFYFENIPFSGQKGRTFIKMSDVQTFQVANIMGFYHHPFIDSFSGEEVTDRRVTREVLLFVPRKFGKTTVMAGFACYDLLFGDANAQAYVGANSYTQATICFNEIRAILKALDPKNTRFKVNREKVYNNSPNKTSFAECLSNAPARLDGLNASVVILDEYSQADSAELKNVLTTSMGTRENPITYYITTASGKNETPFTQMLDHFKAILRGDATDDSVFSHVFEPDEDDDESDPAVWQKVQPHFGITVKSDFYQQEYKKALRSSEDMQAFRNKMLNIFTSGSQDIWLEPTLIEPLMRKDVGNLFAVRGFASVDLSVRDDFSAVTYLLYTPNRVDQVTGNVIPWHSVSKYYIPSATIETHTNRELYMRWADEGYLNIINGETIDYSHIAEDMMKVPYDIRAVGYDSYKSREFVNIMRGVVDKRRLIAVPQTYGAFTSPVESLEIAVRHAQITFDNNPITPYCFGNAVLDEDRMRNKKPMKGNGRSGKIDGVITNLMNLWLVNNLE